MRAKNIGVIPLSNGKHYALVDSEDWEYLSNYTWSYSNGYAVRSEYRRGNSPKQFKMHREIMNPPVGKFIDHINRDGLDNRKSNLRVCTNQQNQYNAKAPATNTSGHKGIHWRSNREHWVVRISAYGKRHYLGSFSDIKQALSVRDLHMAKLQKEFANYDY